VMLRLGMVLLGSALILRARSRSSEDKREEKDEPGSDGAGIPGTKNPDPTLDPALQSVYTTAMPLGYPSWGDLFGNTIPVQFTSPGERPIMPGGAIPGVAGALPSAAQLTAVNRIYKGITGMIPTSLRQEYSNMNRLAEFKARLRRKLRFW